jgi:hypothetical protein
VALGVGSSVRTDRLQCPRAPLSLASKTYPSRFIAIASRSARTRFLSVAECSKLLRDCPTHFGNLAQAALLTGLRPGELVRLTVERFKGTRLEVAAGKRKLRHVRLTRAGQAFFKKLGKKPQPSELMLPNSEGGTWTPMPIARAMRVRYRRWRRKVLPQKSNNLGAAIWTHRSRALRSVPSPVPSPSWWGAPKARSRRRARFSNCRVKPLTGRREWRGSNCQGRQPDHRRPQHRGRQ